MKAEELKINQIIDVSVDEERSPYQAMTSRIEGVEKESLIILVPMYKGSVLPVSLGTRLIVSLIHRGDVYSFNTVVSGRRRDPIPLLTIRKPDVLNKIQRRFWVRMPVALNVGFEIESPGEEKISGQGQTIDLSGGGILMLTDFALQVGQNLNLMIDMQGRGLVQCKGRILRTFHDDITGKSSIKAALEFYEISERSRDFIVKFIFERQREWIKKGVDKT